MIIRWRAFELRPEPVELLDPQGDYLTSAWKNHVYPLAKKMGMPLKMPPIQPRSRLAHEAAKWAATYERLDEFHRAIFRAFFESGLDIGNLGVLMKLAGDLGLDPVALKRSLDNHEFTFQVVSDEEEAMNAGVRAVPAFVADGLVLAAGVQSADRLLELLVAGPGFGELPLI